MCRLRYLSSVLLLYIAPLLLLLLLLFFFTFYLSFADEIKMFKATFAVLESRFGSNTIIFKPLSFCYICILCQRRYFVRQLERWSTVSRLTIHYWSSVLMRFHVGIGTLRVAVAARGNKQQRLNASRRRHAIADRPALTAAHFQHAPLHFPLLVEP